MQFLVRQHLDMVSLSQKRNLGDPQVIQAFAGLVGDLENFRALTLLTVADSMGTSDKLWTTFKDALLLTLFHRTQEHLEGQAVVVEETERARLCEEVARAALPGLDPTRSRRICAVCPGATSRTRSWATSWRILGAVHEFLAAQVWGTGHPFEPMIHCSASESHGCSVVRCCTWDRRGLFARLTGAFTAAGVNILSAAIYTRSDGIVMDTFHVTDPSTGAPLGPRGSSGLPRWRGRHSRANWTLRRCCGAKRLPVRLPMSPRAANGSGPPWSSTRIRARSHTIIEVDAEDRLGLLYTISTTSWRSWGWTSASPASPPPTVSPRMPFMFGKPAAARSIPRPARSKSVPPCSRPSPRCEARSALR